MPIDFNDLITTAVKEKKPGPKKEGSLSYDDLIERQIAPSGTAMNFEDMVPKESRVAFPRATPEQVAEAQAAIDKFKLPRAKGPVSTIDIGPMPTREKPTRIPGGPPTGLPDGMTAPKTAVGLGPVWDVDDKDTRTMAERLGYTEGPQADWLLKRFGKQLYNAFARIGEGIISSPLSPIGIPRRVSRQYEEQASRELDATGFKGGPSQAAQLIRARAAQIAAAKRVPKFDMPPPKGLERGADVAAGLTAFIAQLAIAKKILPKGTSDPLIWEIQNQFTGGAPGEGFAMRSALGLIGKLPIGSLKGKLGKIGLESGLFAGYTTAMGGDVEDIIISGLIPVTFNAWNFAKQKHHLTTYETSLKTGALQKHQQRLKQGMNRATSAAYLKADNRTVDTAVARAKQRIYRDDAFAPAKERWELQRKKALAMIATGKSENVKRGKAILDFLEIKPWSAEPPIKMPTTRAGEIAEQVQRAAKAAVKAPGKLVGELKPIPKAKLPPKPVVLPPITPAKEAKIAAIQRMPDAELRKTYLSAKPTSPEWVEAYKEMRRRKEVEKPPSRPVAPLTKPEAAVTAPAREPIEHLVAMPKAKEARETEPAKGKYILIENPEEKGDYQKYEDFGTGILRKGNKLFHKASLKEIGKFSSVKNARKAATTLAEENIDFKTTDVEKLRTQYDTWRKEKGFETEYTIDKETIQAYLTGEGEELEAKDFPEYMAAWWAKDMPTRWGKPRDEALANLKRFINEVPEFAENPVLTYKEGYLVFSDHYRFRVFPEHFGINKEALVEGDTIRFDLENLGIKKPSAKKLKGAEIWTGEKKILGRETKEPTPVKLYRRERKPRKLTAKEETYERALTDIETGKEVEVPGGVTYHAVREEDIRRVAELGKKAGREAWTVERDILGRQERGKAETKVGIRDAIKIIRNVFAAKPTKEAEEPSEFVPSKPTAKAKLSFEDLISRPADVKHIKNVVVDQFREWPKSIKKVGKDYWTEVMAAAKRLATPYRYKALRRTMLGVFRYKKTPVPKVGGIEMQDVTDALTATHELGHNIDWLLNNKIYPSSIKARFPDTTVGEMSLRNELKNISKILRPDMWERPKPYIKHHTELMADYISHYILDPEKTRELAPNMTRAFEAKLATKPDLFEMISRLQESRYTGPEEPPIARHIREEFPIAKEFTPLQLAINMTDEGYVKAAEELGITAARHYKLLIARAEMEARRIDKLVPNKDRQIDLVVVAENGSENPFTGKTRQEIRAEGITPNEQKAIDLFRGYQERARQTVNKYLRGADIAEYIKFIEDYYIHAYQTPLTEKYKSAIAKWAKRSPQARKRVLPDLAKAVEIGLRPRAKTLSEGLMLWAGINYRVMTNKAFLRILPKITNDDGVSILQKPQDYPDWPTVDYWPIRQTYAVPLPNRGVLLFQGRVAVDPRVKPFIDAMFGRKFFNTPVRIIEAFNAVAKGFELTLFSLFHHQAEFFSAVGALGPRAMPFVGGYYGKRAQAFGKKPKLWGFLPAHISILKAGKQLEECPEFMTDYVAHGGQRGYITTEGINLMERMLKRAADYCEQLVQMEPTTPLTGIYAAAYVPVKTAQAAYSFHQSVLWDNVNRAKLVSYYKIVADGAKNSKLPIKDVKEIAIKYINDNYGGQEWLNTLFRKPKVRQFWSQLMMSLDWTWSQIKTARWPVGIGEKGKERRAFMRKIGRHHWFWYLSAVAGFTIAGSYAMSGKFPWENEIGHKLDVDWTNVWRSLPWNRDWKQRGDYARRYLGIGKAGRELVRWVTSPLRAFGYKLSPGARTVFEQASGFNMGSDFPEPWAREKDMELYREVYHRFGNVMEKFKPFSLSGNNAFLAFPSRKGMTQWKAIRAFEELYNINANIATGGLTAKLTKATYILSKDRKKLAKEIAEACVINNVDVVKSMRAALSSSRSKYYGRFWYAAKRQDVDKCNRYAKALLALGVGEKGFIQSMETRGRQLSIEAVKTGLEAFQVQQRKRRKAK